MGVIKIVKDIKENKDTMHAKIVTKPNTLVKLNELNLNSKGKSYANFTKGVLKKN